MALVPSRHLYFDFFRYTSSSSFPLKQPQNPHKRSPFIALEKPNCGIDKKLSTLSKWNVPNKGYSESGGRGSTMDRIVEKLRKVGYVDDRKGRDLDSGIESVESVFRSDGEVRFPWEKDEDEEGKEKWTARSKSRTFLAEVTLPDSELKRLRRVFYQLKSKIRIKGTGVNEEVLDAIRERWRTSEVVRLKIEGSLALNMKRVHEVVEKRTGGLVIWRSGTSIALYRGVGYEVPSMHQNKKISKRHEISAKTSTTVTNKAVSGPLRFTSHGGVSESRLNSDATSVDEETKEIRLHAGATYENEVDELLDSLGPRYKEWPGCEPLPVDADMLPGIVPGYEPPLRMLPYGVRSSLGQKEASSLLRLARVLPPHFALGRNRQLQGLAVAMIKLWEKSKIAKIALKRGVQLTTSERMAEDLKKLTGGTLLSRRKDSLVFYRGKNFLSPEVSEALLERERLAKSFQDEEEQARLRASTVVVPNVEIVNQSASTGTLEETLDANSRWGKRLDGHHKEMIMREAEIVRHNNIVRKIEKKLALAERKLMKAEIALSKVEEFLKPAERQADPDSITDEERFMFRKLGLRMKAYLLLGRRGVFDGTVENMHLHWKYRELVKIRLKAKSFEHVKKIALALEAESGGILVSVDKVSKGYAIVVYRGKDYKRPSAIRPKNLLTKRKALARSIEMQRREALLKHVSALQTQVDKLRSEIEQMDNVRDEGDKELYDKLDSAYQTDDNETEDDDKGDEAFLEAYNSENDDVDDGNEDKSENSACSVDDGNNFSYNVQNRELETEPEEGEDAAYFDMYDDDYDNDDDKDDKDFDDEDEHDNWVQNSYAKLPIKST